MSIPSSQLNTWAGQGAITTSSEAYASIRHALLKESSPLANRGVEIFLQGSYANATNIYGDSDIDVVVLYANTFHKDMTALTSAQQQLHEAIFPVAEYQWTHLRDEVLTALRSHYGNAAVTPGPKAIKVVTGRGGRPSDVLPALQFRRYSTFVDRNNLSAHWGVQFFDSSGNAIVNYPKYHRDQGEAKNQAERTGGKYKATIRVVKNLRNYMIDHGLLADGIAPSYFIEGGLYNVPDHLFIGDYSETIPAILEYLLATPCSEFLCQNGVVRLFGADSTQWSADRFGRFVIAAKATWDRWYQ